MQIGHGNSKWWDKRIVIVTEFMIRTGNPVYSKGSAGPVNEARLRQGLLLQIDFNDGTSFGQADLLQKHDP